MRSMTLLGFSRFIQFAPIAFQRLLEAFRVPADSQLAHNILSWYSQLPLDDFHFYNRYGNLPASRLLAIAELASLDASLAELPLRIYRLYRDSVRAKLAKQDNLSVPREELLYTLTGGTIPLDLCFVVDELVCSWEQHGGGICSHRIEDNTNAAESKALLRQRGQEFASIAEVCAAAQQRKWTGWESFCSSLSANATAPDSTGTGDATGGDATR